MFIIINLKCYIERVSDTSQKGLSVLYFFDLFIWLIWFLPSMGFKCLDRILVEVPICYQKWYLYDFPLIISSEPLLYFDLEIQSNTFKVDLYIEREIWYVAHHGTQLVRNYRNAQCLLLCAGSACHRHRSAKTRIRLDRGWIAAGSITSWSWSGWIPSAIGWRTVRNI